MSQIRTTEILESMFASSESQLTPFNEQKVSQRTTIFQINGTYEISALRDVIEKTGTSTVTSVNSEFKLTLNTTNESAYMVSARRGRYSPGYAAEAGLGIRIPAKPTGDTKVIFGYLDFEAGTQNINDGAVFGQDSDGTFIAVYRNKVETIKIYQEDWNINPNFSFDTNKGYIVQILFVYYGYGPIIFRVLDVDSDKLIDIHKYQPEGLPALSNSNLQVGAKVSQATNNAEFNVFISGRQFSILGLPVFDRRIVSNFRKDVDVPTANYVPIMSFRRKANNRSVTIQAKEFDVLTNNDILIQWRVDSDISKSDASAITFITPSDHSADETALEVNIDADTIDMETGVKLDEELVKGGSGPNPRGFKEDSFDSDIPDEYLVTICAKSIDTGAATVSIIGKMIEER